MSRQDTFSAEQRLLLLLVRGTLTGEHQDRARSLLQQELSWPLILRLARAHGLFPFLFQNLDRLGFFGVPEEARQQLTALCRMNVGRMLLLGEELGRLLRAFRAAAIPVIPMKGVALAETLYGDPTLRVCTDLDILVPRESVPRAFGLLLDDAYQIGQACKVSAAEIDLLLDSTMEYTFVRRGQGIPVFLELHWSIAWRWPREGPAMDDLWAESRPSTVLGVQARALSPEWELLSLAVHAARHRWQQLKWLLDVHEICSRGGISWERLGAKASHLGWQTPLRLTLSAAHALFCTPIPEEWDQITLPSWFPLFPADPAHPDVWQEASLPLRLLARPSDKLRYLARVVFVPTLADRRLVRLPSLLGFLYYLLRPLRLAWKWGYGVGGEGNLTSEARRESTERGMGRVSS